ncbi:hypothetical protein J7K07_04625 [Candidatus Bathyarchaeota archaeon]|nr:hypothetical protein [Candidatus Bathyarchaeota archaeon]
MTSYKKKPQKTYDLRGKIKVKDRFLRWGRETARDASFSRKDGRGDRYCRRGELICPHCKAPLLTEERADGRFYCIFCKNEIANLTEETMKRMVDDFPDDLLREWIIETKNS